MGQKIAFATSHYDLTPKPAVFNIGESHYANGARRSRPGTTDEWNQRNLKKNSLFSGFPNFSPNGELWDGTFVADNTFVETVSVPEFVLGWENGVGWGYTCSYFPESTDTPLPNMKPNQTDPNSILVGDGTGYAGPFTLEEAIAIYWRVKEWKTSGFTGGGGLAITGWESTGSTQAYYKNFAPDGDDEKRLISGGWYNARGSGHVKKGLTTSSDGYPLEMWATSGWQWGGGYNGGAKNGTCYEDDPMMAYPGNIGDDPYNCSFMYSPSADNSRALFIIQCDPRTGDYYGDPATGCSAAYIPAFFSYEFTRGPVVSLKNDPDKYYIPFVIDAEAHSYAADTTDAYFLMMEYDRARASEEVHLSNTKPFPKVGNGSGERTCAETQTQAEASGSFTDAPEQQITLIAPGSNRAVPIKLYGTKRIGSARWQFGQLYEPEYMISAPDTNLILSGLTIQPSKYWEYDDGNGNPIWDKDTGDMLRDPITGETV
jgi:hypothetical protein